MQKCCSVRLLLPQLWPDRPAAAPDMNARLRLVDVAKNLCSGVVTTSSGYRGGRVAGQVYTHVAGRGGVHGGSPGGAGAARGALPGGGSERKKKRGSRLRKLIAGGPTNTVK